MGTLMVMGVDSHLDTVAAAVVDANDLGRVEICGASPFIDHDLLVAAMKPNPQGNADERTPLVLVRA